MNQPNIPTSTQRLQRRQLLGLSLACLPVLHVPQAQASAERKGAAMTMNFRGMEYLHRWSKDDQHEFTPQGQADLKAWHNMLTINVHAKARDGEQLAQVANTVLGNMKRHGQVLRTHSKARTSSSPAEHLIVAMLGTDEFLEATFIRCMLHGGGALVLVYSHRVYGRKNGGTPMSQWLAANGQATEDALMAMAHLPSLASLSALQRGA